MQHLNKEATATISELLKRMKDNEVLHLTRKNANDIVFTKYAGIVKMDLGIGHYYRLTSYTRLDTERFRDPEIQLIIVDNRKTPQELNSLLIYPESLRNDFHDAHIKAILTAGEEISQVNNILLADLCTYTEYFMPNIQHNYLPKPFFSRLFGK